MVDFIFVNDQSGSTCGEDQLPNDHFTTEVTGFDVDGEPITTCKQLLESNGVYPGGDFNDGKIPYAGERVYKYEAQRRFMQDLLDQFQLDDVGKARFALVGFAEKDAYDATPDPATGELPATINGYRKMLDFSSEYSDIVAAIETSTSAGDTYLAGALNTAKAMFDDHARPNAQQIVIVLLDGEPSEWLVKKTNASRFKNEEDANTLSSTIATLQSQATVMAVGYSSANAGTIPEQIATQPEEDGGRWAFKADQIDNVITQLTDGNHSICKQVRQLPNVTTISSTAVTTATPTTETSKITMTASSTTTSVSSATSTVGTPLSSSAPRRR